jgi:hypothetical protein
MTRTGAIPGPREARRGTGPRTDMLGTREGRGRPCRDAGRAWTSRAGHGRVAGLMVVPGHGARRVRRARRAGHAGHEPRQGETAPRALRSGHCVPRRGQRVPRRAVPRAPWPRAAPAEHATPARSEHAGRAPAMAGECHVGRREKRGGEEGGGGEGRAYHGDGDGAAAQHASALGRGRTSGSWALAPPPTRVHAGDGWERAGG